MVETSSAKRIEPSDKFDETLRLILRIGCFIVSIDFEDFLLIEFL